MRDGRLFFAFRLCLELGIDDPRRWLNSVDDELVDLWEAYYRMEPFGNSWLQTAVVCQTQSVTSSYVAASCGAKVKPTEWKHFMPTTFKQPKSDKPKRRMMSGEEAFAMLKARFK